MRIEALVKEEIENYQAKGQREKVKVSFAFSL